MQGQAGLTITGGEPLLYSKAPQLVREGLARGKHIYFCTNGLLLEETLPLLSRPRIYVDVHFDGTEAVHDMIIGKPGGFSKGPSPAAAKAMGFRVSTDTTVYRDSSVRDLAVLFEQLKNAGVDGILVAPGFSYEEVAEDVFLTRNEIEKKFREISSWGRNFPFISNPLYLEFVCRGKVSEVHSVGKSYSQSPGLEIPLLPDYGYPLPHLCRTDGADRLGPLRTPAPTPGVPSASCTVASNTQSCARWACGTAFVCSSGT